MDNHSQPATLSSFGELTVVLAESINKSARDSLIEREGRYFVQCSDAEVEVTLQELDQQSKAIESAREYWRLWEEKYGHNNWAAKDTPADAAMHLALYRFFDRARTYYQEQFAMGESMDIAYRVCDFNILETKRQLANPYADKTVLAPFLTGWELLKEWLDFLSSGPSLSSQPFAPLLLNYTLAELTALLGELGLFDTATGRPTPAASPGAWVGVIHGLLEEPRPRLKGSKAAIWQAFSGAFGAVGSERTVQNGLGTRGSTAEQFKDRTLALLKE